MITLLRAKERHYERHREQEVWLTFYPRDRANARADHFGPLEGLSERRLPPGAIASRTPHHHDAEIVTYVREGALAYEDAPGCSGVIRAGEFQGTTAGRGIRRREKNASRSDWARVFQLLLAPSGPRLKPGHEQKRFSAIWRVPGVQDARCCRPYSSLGARDERLHSTTRARFLISSLAATIPRASSGMLATGTCFSAYCRMVTNVSAIASMRLAE